MDNQQSTVTQDGFPTLEDMQGNTQMTLFSLQDMAVTNSNGIEQLQKELKTASEMHAESFTNDPRFREEAQKVKEVTTGLKVIKANIERQPAVIALAGRVKELKDELKEKKASVSDYAIEVYRMTGIREFERDGQTFEIKTVAKLVKRKQ